MNLGLFMVGDDAGLTLCYLCVTCSVFIVKRIALIIIFHGCTCSVFIYLGNSDDNPVVISLP